MKFRNKCIFEKYKLLFTCRQYSTCALKWPIENYKKLSVDQLTRIETHWSSAFTARGEKHDFEFSNKSQDATKKYILPMFPYPSGSLHLGHARVYTFSDMLARLYRLKGYNVLHPIGWDAFGLPAENAALQNNLSPSKWTESNIVKMREQLQKLGVFFNWDREIFTCRSDYYKWTQWLFIRMVDAGLVSKSLSVVNWDPVDNTVLADEQINEDGRSWRSNAKVEKKLLRQWTIKTTKFAEPMSKALDSMVEKWQSISQIQKHWIGECDYTAFYLPLINRQTSEYVKDTNLRILLSESRQLQKATIVLLRSNHPLTMLYSSELIGNDDPNYFKILPIVAYNPVTNQNMALVSPNNEAEMFRTESGSESPLDARLAMLAQATQRSNDENLDARIMLLDDVPQNFFEVEEETSEVLKDSNESLNATNDIRSKADLISEQIEQDALNSGWGGFKTSAHLHDWVVSRQRYWGTPIPIVHCHECGAVPVPDDHLPVELPMIEQLPQSSEDGQSPLANISEWVKTECPVCGLDAQRETDTLDTFFDSAWYFLRYCTPTNLAAPFDRKIADELMPVDVYVGGKEHAYLHLFYARFLCYFLHDEGLLSHKEPFDTLLTQGVVKAYSYFGKDSQRYYTPEEITVENNKHVVRSTGEEVELAMEKMSKSKLNGIDPLTLIDRYGIDLTRAMIVSDASPFKDREWRHGEEKGPLNWLSRITWCVNEFIKQKQQLADDTDESMVKKHDADLYKTYQYALRNVNYNYTQTHLFNVAISRMHALTSKLRNYPPNLMARSQHYEDALRALLILAYPICPNFTAELFAAINSVTQPRGVIHEQSWPEPSIDAEYEIILYINGQRAGVLKVDYQELSQPKEQIFEDALKADRFTQVLGERRISSSYSKYVRVPYLGGELYTVTIDETDNEEFKNDLPIRRKKYVTFDN